MTPFFVVIWSSAIKKQSIKNLPLNLKGFFFNSPQPAGKIKWYLNQCQLTGRDINLTMRRTQLTFGVGSVIIDFPLKKLVCQSSNSGLNTFVCIYFGSFGETIDCSFWDGTGGPSMSKKHSDLNLEIFITFFKVIKSYCLIFKNRVYISVSNNFNTLRMFAVYFHIHKNGENLITLMPQFSFRIFRTTKY